MKLGSSGVVHWFFIFLLHILNNVSAQPGFISLDCGAFDGHTDSNGIEWIPDDDYVIGGKTASISSDITDMDEIFQRLRYFPDTQKHCYTFPVAVEELYILRPNFFYGNYDGHNSTETQFDILIGANVVDTISIELLYSIYLELLVKATTSTIDLCFASLSANVPFVSTIELRKLDQDMSKTFSNFSKILVMLRRVDVGSDPESADIRFPEDHYDRKWRADSSKNYRARSTIKNISVDTSPNKPPIRVMSTAITSDINSQIVFKFPIDYTTPSAHVNFYFAEFEALGNNTREFDIYFNNSVSGLHQLSVAINVEKMTGAPLRAWQVYSEQPIQISSDTYFFFNPTTKSTLGPILNGAELFEYLQIQDNPGTNAEDVAAIREVMKYFNLTGWSGDPCLPKAYKWAWITCDKSYEPRIIELNLSKQLLTGAVPVNSINKLIHLTKIYLDNNALTGPVPHFSSLKNLTVLSLQNNHLDCNACKKGHMKVFPIVIVVPGAIVILLVAGSVVYYTCMRKEVAKPPNSTGKSIGSSIKNFSYKDVVDATNNFKQIIGEGGFGPVYYGCLASGEEVAVKVSSSEGLKKGYQEFYAEIEILSVVHHKNLVSFLGYCNQNSKLILVYEYMSNGTLRDNLYGKDCRTLSWTERLRAALDAAQGLEYLHTSCNWNIIHRDIKTSNILLNSAMVAKLGDFGLSKTFQKEGASHVTTIVRGTPGYLDPEYHSYNRLTQKSDVYSFGVVMFEIVCGRKPIDTSLPEDEISLLRWACEELERGNVKGIIDPSIPDYKEQAVWKVLDVAMSCVEQSSEFRPSMSIVVSELKEAIQLQEGRTSPPDPSIELLSEGRW